MGSSLTDDEIRLAVPASPEFVRLARLTAAGLANRVGFSYDEVEDLRIAVGEACSLLIGTTGREGSVSLVFRLGNDELEVEAVASTPAGASDREDADHALSASILDAVVDDFDVSPGAVVLRKRRVDGAGHP